VNPKTAKLPRRPGITLVQAIGRVKEYDSHRRLHVPSRSTDNLYLVDLDEYDGTGQCGCRDFETRHQPYLNGSKASEGYSPERRCWHLIVAFHWFAEYKRREEVRWEAAKE
jgi:hypothetical protein